jgi:Spermidine synthase
MSPVQVPEGTSGDWRVEKFVVSPEDSARSLFSYRDRAPSPGTYTRLMRGRTVVMSDVPAEMRDHWSAVHHATGSVLINGLGLGMVLQACLEKPEVTDVTVIEFSADVIRLVAPRIKPILASPLSRQMRFYGNLRNGNVIRWSGTTYGTT